MKRSVILICLFLLPFTLAQNLYQQDTLQLQLGVQGEFELVGKSPSAEVKDASANLLLFPKESFRQELLKLETSGDVLDDSVRYSWKDHTLGKKTFGYQAQVKTKNARQAVTQKVPFPLTENNGYERYTFPSRKIDSDHPAIVAKARELAEGEDDLFQFAFNVGRWVTENVRYDLNSLTTNVAQKASWVLENKQGVCDEMTSLFVAMMRSQGVPARFVSGISYTEHPDVVATLGTNWASHGWAEVYFPKVGWVPFDLTFDEYGYVDVTHITLREGLDPDDAATTYQWLAEDVELKTQPLKQEAAVQKEGIFVPEEISLAVEVLADDVDLGSYNVIKGILKNTADYYVATSLRLAVPDQVKVLDDKKRAFLLEPKEVKETSWVVKVQDNLDPNYQYQFPVIVYSEKNISYTDSFSAKKGQTLFTSEEIKSLVVQDEEKSYSRKLAFSCDYPPEVQLKSSLTLSCILKNQGEQELKAVHFCLGETCINEDLLPGKEMQLQRSMPAEEAGWQKVVVSAENELVEKRIVAQYRVLDAPQLDVETEIPERVLFGQKVPLQLQVKKVSFSLPTDITIMLKGLGVEQQWEIADLVRDETLTTTFDGKLLAAKNAFELQATWKDSTGKEFSLKKTFSVQGEGNSLSQKLRMTMNRILQWITR